LFSIVAFKTLIFSQSSVATHLRCGEIFCDYKCSPDSESEKSLKICQYLMKMRRTTKCASFFGHTVDMINHSTVNQQKHKSTRVKNVYIRKSWSALHDSVHTLEHSGKSKTRCFTSRSHHYRNSCSGWWWMD